MTRRTFATISLVLAGLLLAGAAHADTRTERGVVLERTRHTLLVRQPDGDRQVYHRNRHTEVRGVDRWRELTRGDRVKLKVRDARRGRHLLARVKFLGHGRDRDARRYGYDDRSRHRGHGFAYRGHRDDSAHRKVRALSGRVAHVDRNRLVLLTDSGDRVALRLDHDTRWRGFGNLRDLDDCDRLEVRYRPRRGGDPQALDVAYLGRERPFWLSRAW